MKQGILPLVPSGATRIDGNHSIDNDGVTVTWFHGSDPIRVHPVSDHATQRAMMAFLHVHANVPQVCLAQALNVHKNTVRAAARLYENQGDAGFYAKTQTRGPAVLVPEVMDKCRSLLVAGHSRSAVAAATGIKKSNIDKAIQKGLLPAPARLSPSSAALSLDASSSCPSTRSARVGLDAAAAQDIGMACVRTEERIMAACGLLSGTETRFEKSLDVEHGGVLCALPALSANGLYSHLQLLDLRLGAFYYSLTHIFTLLAFMALLRVKTVESLRRNCPGEFGKLLGLDRIPEVRCLRERLAQLAATPEDVNLWANALSKDWMGANQELAGTLYVDGHVRVYHGNQTELPRRHVATHRLCMRGVTDYWVNDRDGNPFFYVDRPIDDGLLAVLRSEIVPRLLVDIPGQPNGQELAADKWRHRFRLVFDRAGCSFRFFAEMWNGFRIACMTYLKGVLDEWPESEFDKIPVRGANGQTETMELAERGIWFGNGNEGIWCREFRRLRRGRHGNHQTAIVCTDFKCRLDDGVAAMFARWNQENFFRYMLLEFGLDLQADYATEVFPCRIKVVNPAWKAIDGACGVVRGKIQAEKVRLANLTLQMQDMTTGRMKDWVEKKTTATAEIAALNIKLDDLRTQRKAISKHIPFDDLPAEHKFERLAPTRKLILDTVRMIAYRAESALAELARPVLSNPEEARAMVKALCLTTADLYPDNERKEIRIVLHPLAEPRQNRMVETILAHLNETEFIYPGTELRMVYQMLPVPPAPPSITPGG